MSYGVYAILFNKKNLKYLEVWNFFHTFAFTLNLTHKNMSKLLTQPRIPKNITQPVKKAKRFKPEPKETTEEKVKFTLIKESDKKEVNELFRIYKEDPFKARVKYHNKGKGSFTFTRLVLFEFNKDDFEICQFSVNFGISTTNRIYSSQKKLASISYKKGKFWCINNRNKNKSICPLTYGTFVSFIQETENLYTWKKEDGSFIEKSEVFKYFYKRFPWVLMLSESDISMGANMNVIKNQKLFGMKDLNRHVMKVPNNIAKIVMESKTFETLKNQGQAIKRWHGVMKVLDNLENVTPELLNDHLFADTCKMANTLGRKINCAWGSKRLKEEHDKWAKEITRIVLDCELEYVLNIRPIYKAFANFSGYRLLKTNKDMLAEGMMQHHCVGTYIDQVDRGQSAIFHVKGYTLQLNVIDLNWDTYKSRTEKVHPHHMSETYNNKGLYEKIDPSHNKALVNAQFRGKFNEQAPQELVDEVNKMMIDFINADGFENTAKGEKTYHPNYANRGTVNNMLMAFGVDNLPF